ncbi:MAG: hypothetical protein IPJ30_03845 [Acidobacteria bacterium]|nr:hypothetical protein [Acidobacteriota bacterium]
MKNLTTCKKTIALPRMTRINLKMRINGQLASGSLIRRFYGLYAKCSSEFDSDEHFSFRDLLIGYGNRNDSMRLASICRRLITKPDNLGWISEIDLFFAISCLDPALQYPAHFLGFCDSIQSS